MADITQQAQQYYYLVQKGVPPAEAFKQAFPNGVPTALDRQKELAKDKQKQGYGQIAGALAGLAGTKYLVDKVPGWFATEGAQQMGSQVAGNAAGSSVGFVAEGSAGIGLKGAASQAGTEGATITNTLPPGAEVTADGAIVDPATGATIGKVVQGAAGAYQIYQGINEFKDDKIGGSLGVASGAANLGAAAGSQTAGSFAGPLMIAKGGYDTYNSFQNGGEGIRSAATTTGAGIGSFAGPVGTVVGAAAGNTIGYGLQGDGIKNDIALAPLTFGASLIPGVGDAIRGGLIHKTTKQHQQEKWAEMAQSDDPATAAYAQQYLDVIGQSDGSGPTFEDIQGREGGGSGRDVWGASAFFDAYKDKGGWLNTTEAQREAIAKRALDEGLLTGDHGDIVATSDDSLERIKQIGDEVIGMNMKAPLIQSTKLPTVQQMKSPTILGNSNQYKPYTPPNKDPNDPNTYGIDADGNVRGTLMGYVPQGSNNSLSQWANQKLTTTQAPSVSLADALKPAGLSQKPTQQVMDRMYLIGRDGAAPQSPMLQALTPARSKTSSPGIDKNGRRIVY
jgi:hypothetical protein